MSSSPVRPQEQSLSEAAVAVKDAAVVLGGQLAATLAIADRTLLRAAAEHPYMLLGGAAGAGFVAGGGLAAPITRHLFRFGFKTASGFVLDAALRVLAPPPSPPLADGDLHTPANAEDQRRETSSSDPSSLNNVAHP